MVYKILLHYYSVILILFLFYTIIAFNYIIITKEFSDNTARYYIYYVFTLYLYIFKLILSGVDSYIIDVLCYRGRDDNSCYYVDISQSLLIK